MCCSGINITLDLLQLGITTSDPLCFGEIGSVLANPLGGTPPYEVTYQGASAGVNLTGLNLPLAVDTYTVYLKDAHNCTFPSTTIEIHTPGNSSVVPIIRSVNFFVAPLQLHVDTHDALCFGEIGSVIATPLGGTPPYEVIFQDSSSINISGTNLPLTVGSYNVYLIDSNNCTFPSTTIQIHQPNPLQLDLTPFTAQCYGENASVLATPSGGTPPYQVIFQNSIFPILNFSGTGLSLAPDTYEVFLTDANDCTIPPSTIELLQPGLWHIICEENF